MQLLNLTVLGLCLVIATLIEDNNAWLFRPNIWNRGNSGRWKLVRPYSSFSNCTVTHNTFKGQESYAYKWKRGLTECGKDASQNFDDYDKNRDGKISLREFATSTKCKVKEIIKGFLLADKNADTLIDKVEFVFLPFITEDKKVDINGNVDEFIQDAVLQAEEDGKNEVIIKLEKDPDPGESEEADNEAEEESEESDLKQQKREEDEELDEYF